MKTITYREIKDFIKNNSGIPDNAEIKVNDNFFVQLNKLSESVLCDCYHEETRKEPRYNQFTGHIDHYVDITRGVCWGTRECDECNCHGNVQKCTHYPEKRSKIK